MVMLGQHVCHIMVTQKLFFADHRIATVGMHRSLIGTCVYAISMLGPQDLANFPEMIKSLLY